MCVRSCCAPERLCGVAVGHIEGVRMVFTNFVQCLEAKVIIIWSIFIANLALLKNISFHLWTKLFGVSSGNSRCGNVIKKVKCFNLCR